MASTPQARATTLLNLADELLEEIFLRLPAAADLARASMTRVSFRRLITDHRFLRRFRAGHPPPLLGIISPPRRSDRLERSTRLAQPPHPSAAAAASTFHAADFSCLFLPSDHGCWIRRDLRDGRVLFSGLPDGIRFSFRILLRDMAVCDPLYHRYILLPAIPDDLAALAQPLDVLHFEPFLAPPADEDKEDLSFRVICLAQCATKLVLFIFSSAAGQWHAVTFDTLTTLMTGSDIPAPSEPYWWPHMRHYAHGCFCWAFYPEGKLIMLDTRTMDFSAVDLPPGTYETQVVILEAGKGRLGMFVYDEHLTHELSYLVLRNDGHGANQWQSEAVFNLPVYKRYTLLGVAGGYLLLQGSSEHEYSDPLAEKEDLDVFSLNLKTLQLQWFFASKYCFLNVHLIASFPPSLSPPTI